MSIAQENRARRRASPTARWYALAAWLGLASPLAAYTPVEGIQGVATGHDHSCLIDAGGGVQCWGLNGDGQLGDGSYTDRSIPTPVVGLQSGVVSLALGGWFSCARLGTGEVKCWGRNFEGQLGDDTFGGRATPAPVSALGTSTLALEAGGDHACAIVSGGALQCWGRNDEGQIGDNSNSDRDTLTAVSGLGSGVTAIAAGYNHTCAVVGSAVRCWGDNQSGGLGDGSQDMRLVPTAVTGLASGYGGVAAGHRWSCALTSTGAVKCWGHNADGNVGDGTFDMRLTPVDVVGLQADVSAIRAGFGATCARRNDAGLRCWGLNSRGQLGDGTYLYREIPVTPIGLGSGITSVALGNAHGCARRSDASLHCWGFNAVGQLGDGTTSARTSPQAVAGLASGARHLDLGFHFSCAVTDARGVRCWGVFNTETDDGYPGNGRIPFDIAGLADVATVSSGENHACALTQGGAVSCWGINDAGQLGNGSYTTSFTPVTPVGLGSGVAQISAGGAYACARMLTGGSVRCWGANAYGQLGDGGNSDRNTPADVTGLTGTTWISAGWRHACAVVAGGGAKCWGDNVGDGATGGQLGTGTRVSSNVPVDVVAAGISFARLSAGGNFTCGLSTGGAALCWGDNANGAIGDGTNDDRLIATPVSGLSSGVVAIAAGGQYPNGDEHACAVDGNGAVWCWGANRFGQLADGSTLFRNAPAASGLRAGIVDVSTGGDHACARSAAGAVFCWGYDQLGQVGDGSRDPTLAASVLSETRDEVRAVSGGNLASRAAASDADGRYLVFESEADGLVAGDSNGTTDVFRRDTQTGSIERVSVDDSDAQIAGASIEPAVSANGQYVVLVAPDAAVVTLKGETKAAQERRRKTTSFGVLLRNLVTGSTQRLGSALPGGTGTRPQISPDGSTVVYGAKPETMQQGDPTKPAIFRRKLALTGAELTPLAPPDCLSCKAIAVAGVDTSTNASGESRAPVISANGTMLAFETDAKNLLDGVTSPCPGISTEIILRNLITGAVNRISPPPGTLACGTAGASHPSLDYSGQRLAYQSDAVLAPGDANLAQDVYVYDTSGGTRRVSTDSASRAEPNGDSQQPALSGDGQVVVFRSIAMNLEASLADNNEADDIVSVRVDRSLSRVVSRSRRGDQANFLSRRPATNYSGTKIAFDSDASNLLVDPATGATLDGNGVSDVFAVSNVAAADRVFRSGME